MQTDKLCDYLDTHWQPLQPDILFGTCRPQTVRKVEIPKASGGKGIQGIPTVTDRVMNSITGYIESTLKLKVNLNLKPTTTIQ